MLAPAIPDFDQVTFGGEVSIENILPFATSQFQFGWAINVILFFTVLSNFAYPFSSNVLLPLQVIVVFAALIWIVVIQFLHWGLFAGARRQMAEQLVNARPWLLGQVRGTITGSNMTIWHQDVGLQIAINEIYRRFRRNAIVESTSNRPFSVVPTTCFVESDWHSFMDLLEHTTTGSLSALPATPEAHFCSIPAKRLPFLEMRLRGYRWQGTTSGAPWLLAAVFVFCAYLSIDPWGLPNPYLLSIPVLVLLLHVGRIALWTWHTRRQFSTSTRGYFGNKPSTEKMAASWFDSTDLFWMDENIWYKIPTRYIDKVRMDDSCIEILASGVSMKFHREGFSNYSAWLSACETATSFRNS